MMPPALRPLSCGSRMNPSMGLGGDIPVADTPARQRAESRLPLVRLRAENFEGIETEGLA